MEWYIRIAASKEGSIEDVDPALAESFAQSWDHSVISFGPGSYGISFGIDASLIGYASTRALDLFEHARIEAGLPLWPVTTLEIMSKADLEQSFESHRLPQLLDACEVSALLNVPPSQVETAVASVGIGPLYRLRGGPLWHADAIANAKDLLAGKK